MKAVRFDEYGGIEVLEVRDVARPEPGPGQVLVAVRAASINPSEAAIRAGRVRDIFPATFPSGEGSDLAGVVEEVGADVTGVAVGEEVIGFTNNRASHAEYVLVETANLTAKPAAVPWEVAGALFVAGVTGVATVRAVAPTVGEAVVIAGAGGGVGVFAVQLAVRTGARVIALASERHHAWLRECGAFPSRTAMASGSASWWPPKRRRWPRSSISSGADTSSLRSSSASPGTASTPSSTSPRSRSTVSRARAARKQRAR